ncbi:hypothetical protein NEHOM01_1799 [Nematocida homosporus]|uniref:uncharacterized protein n=1 Tax=Nematocida homosporus TaxID=1912981 RepID=UPI00221EE466|nr:uncharacterized protein NEHOM01_1799 [Nematocida homosporus]KAI5186915.1 hypothetical protein NEHOM01_1799 [Nematocida homosporus]
MKQRPKKTPDTEPVEGLDLAIKNIELKEEIRALKERQTTILRESLKHQYNRYRTQAEAERLLTTQKEALQALMTQTNEALQALKEMAQPPTAQSNPTKSTPTQPFKENPPRPK